MNRQGLPRWRLHKQQADTGLSEQQQERVRKMQSLEGPNVVDSNVNSGRNGSKSRSSAREPHERQRHALNTNIRATGYMFVPASGLGGPGSGAGTRRTMRAHVMHNYLNRKDDQAQTSATITSPLVTGGKRMRFRLTSGGLERRYPYRYGKTSVNEDQERPAEDESQCRSGSMITYRLEDTAKFGYDALAPFPRSTRSSRSGPLQEEDIGLNDPLLGLGLGHIDPVGALSFELDPTDEVLLDRFHHYERWPWCPISGQSLWSPFALSDKLVFHATIYSWAMHFRSHFIGDARQEAAVLKHKTAAISIINSRISQPQYTTKDETLAAVCVITNVELWFGEAADAQRHMDGLHALVTLRGGINTLSHGIQKLLQRLISWNDLTISQLYGTRLRFPPLELWDEAWRLVDRPSLPGWPTGLAIGELRAAGVKLHESVCAVHSMRQLCHMEALQPVKTLPESEKMMRLDALAYIERHIHVLVQTSELSIVTDDNSSMWRVVSLTSAMYANHWLRGKALNSDSFVVWVRKLQKALLRLSPELSEMSFAPSMILWVRAVAAIVSEHQNSHQWFLDRLAEACVGWNLDWLNFRLSLADFLWVGDEDETRYAELWRKIEWRMPQLYGR